MVYEIKLHYYSFWIFVPHCIFVPPQLLFVQFKTSKLPKTNIIDKLIILVTCLVTLKTYLFFLWLFRKTHKQNMYFLDKYIKSLTTLVS